MPYARGIMTFETPITVLLFGFGLLLPWGVALTKRVKLPHADSARGTVPRSAAAHSLLAYVLAFNLTFLLQELFLVLPKAMVSGLEPTLYHNNHVWEGEAPIAALFQGTGALAILISGLIFAVIAARQAKPNFLILWLAFHGLFQSLPQFVVGAITAGNDVGQAYDYLRLGPSGETALAMLALAAMPIAGLVIGRRFLAAAWDPKQAEAERGRYGFLLRMAGQPALAAIPIIILFRVPREAIEVLAPPVLVPLFGIAWLQLAAFRPRGHASASGEAPTQLWPLAIACLLLLAFFQIVLRPGIAF